MSAPTLDVVRGFIASRQRELLDEIAECYEEIAAWQRKIDRLRAELHEVAASTADDWLDATLNARYGGRVADGCER